MTNENKCPKCDGHMEEGVIKDRMPGGMVQSMWTDKVKFVFFRDDKEKKIQAFRCVKCGYLESYAK